MQVSKGQNNNVEMVDVFGKVVEKKDKFIQFVTIFFALTTWLTIDRFREHESTI